MPTTPQGIWYPDSATNITPLETVFATMATSIDNSLPDDTGPVAITVASGYSGSPTVRRVGKAVYLRGTISPTSGNFTSGAAVTVATLPAGYRPPSTTVGALGFGGTIHGAYSINASTGAITVRPDGVGASVDLSGCTPYLVG